MRKHRFAQMLRRVRNTVFAFVVAMPLTALGAGIPVYDALGWLQQYMWWIRQVQEWEQQIKALEDYIDSPFAETVDGLLEVVDLVDSHMGEYGGVEGYLELFQETPFYRATECFTNESPCSPARIAELMRTDEIGIQGVKRSNDRIFRGIERQQENLRLDAERLREMQSRVSRPNQGRNAQLQAAAQLAAEQTNQLMQIRTLLIAQQQMQTTQSQLRSNQQAREHALQELLQSGEYQNPGSVESWGSTP